MQILKFALILNSMSNRAMGQGHDSNMVLSFLKLLKWNSLPHLFDVRPAQQFGLSCGICQQVLL